MIGSVRTVVITLATISLAACDVAPNIELYNGFGRPLTLDITKGSEPATQVRLKPGDSVRVWNIYGPRFRLKWDGCERLYELPYMDMNHPWRIADGHGGSSPDYDHLYPVRIQLQPDGVLHLRPGKSEGVVSPDRLAGAQGHGYPLKPVGTCR